MSNWDPERDKVARAKLQAMLDVQIEKLADAGYFDPDKHDDEEMTLP